MKYMFDTNACIRLLKGDSPLLLKRVQMFPSKILLFRQLFASNYTMALIKVIEKKKR